MKIEDYNLGLVNND